MAKNGIIIILLAFSIILSWQYARQDAKIKKTETEYQQKMNEYSNAINIYSRLMPIEKRYEVQIDAYLTEFNGQKCIAIKNNLGMEFDIASVSVDPSLPMPDTGTEIFLPEFSKNKKVLITLDHFKSIRGERILGAGWETTTIGIFTGLIKTEEGIIEIKSTLFRPGKALQYRESGPSQD